MLAPMGKSVYIMPIRSQKDFLRLHHFYVLHNFP